MIEGIDGFMKVMGFIRYDAVETRALQTIYEMYAKEL